MKHFDKILVGQLGVVSGFDEWYKSLNKRNKDFFKAIVNSAFQENDSLALIFKEQDKLDKHIISKKAAFEPQIKDILFQMVDEVFEAKKHIKSKWWKLNEKEDRILFLEEMVDVLHFFVSALLKAGFESTDLVDGYFEKSKENHKRADSEY